MKTTTVSKSADQVQAEAVRELGQAAARLSLDALRVARLAAAVVQANAEAA